MKNTILQIWPNQASVLPLTVLGTGLIMGLVGCGGGGTAQPPMPTSIAVDVFGARGATLNAQITVRNCATDPSITWISSSGAILGTDRFLNDIQPDAAIIATASCGNATVSQTVQPNVVYSTLGAFGVLQNGIATVWGSTSWGGNSTSAAPYKNITKLIPCDRGFSALLSDNTVVTWGSSWVSASNPNSVSNGTGTLTNINTVIPGRVANFGIKKDGSFVAWGTFRAIDSSGGTAINNSTKGIPKATLAALTNITSIASTVGGYAALKSDGSVITFGNVDLGGDSSAVKAQLNGVTKIVGTNYDFVALKKDGTLVPWGEKFGYIEPDVELPPNQTNVYVNGVVGVSLDVNRVATAFGYTLIEAADFTKYTGKSGLANVVNVSATQSAFAALHADGSVTSWGDDERMANSLASVQSSLKTVANVTSTENAFAALRRDGTVLTWGDGFVGGDSSAVSSKLVNVVTVTSNRFAFAALKSDGSVVTWGIPGKGGDSSSPTSALVNVRAIYSTPYGGFLAIKKDGTVATWGDAWAGGSGVPPTLNIQLTN